MRIAIWGDGNGATTLFERFMISLRGRKGQALPRERMSGYRYRSGPSFAKFGGGRSILQLERDRTMGLGDQMPG